MATDTAYDTLVIAGGSVKGVVTLGAIQYMYDNFLLRKVARYIGTSSGAIIAFLLIIGYTPVEIMVYICSNRLLERLQHFNVIAMVQGRGASSFATIREQLEKMTVSKIGYLPSLSDLKTQFGKTLTVVTHNLTRGSTEYLSDQTDPDLSCIAALHMSANLPLLFAPVSYKGCQYIDGGISDNFAIDLGLSQGTNVLGLVLADRRGGPSSDGRGPINDGPPQDPPPADAETVNMLEYVYKLIFIPIKQANAFKIKYARERNAVIVELEHDKLKFFNFNVDSNTRLEMFSHGYRQMNAKHEDMLQARRAQPQASQDSNELSQDGAGTTAE